MNKEQLQKVTISLVIGIPLLLLTTWFLTKEITKSNIRKEISTEQAENESSELNKTIEETDLSAAEFQKRLCHDLMDSINGLHETKSVIKFLGKDYDYHEKSGKHELYIYLKPNYCNKVIGVRNHPDTYFLDEAVEIIRQDWPIINGKRISTYTYIPTISPDIEKQVEYSVIFYADEK